MNVSRVYWPFIVSEVYSFLWEENFKEQLGWDLASRNWVSELLKS